MPEPRKVVNRENKLLRSALYYAGKYAWLIHPCKPDKRPCLKNWQDKATNDPEQIKKWWKKWPDALIGCATGPDSGIWVLDADYPEGPEQAKQMDLPETFIQETGGGGLQYFFAWNGRNIRNSSRKIAPGIDVRGDGGYVILPPSLHPAGVVYRWISNQKLSFAPEWLAEKAEKRKNPAREGDSNINKYAQAALSGEMQAIMTAPEGTRNETLNQAAFNLGQLVAGGELDENLVYNALHSIAITSGLTESETTKTVRSGLESGKEHPRKSNKSNGSNGSNAGNGSNGINTGNEKSRLVTKSNAEVTKVTPGNGRFEGNLTGHIRQFVQENQGSFTNSDIDREFGLYHPNDKNLRRRALNKIKKEKIIKSDRRISGKYHIVKQEIEWIDLTKTEDSYFSINLPLSLSRVVRLPKKCICVVAGAANAGKTAFILDVLRRNQDQGYKKLYLMSEMGPSEYRQRVKKFADVEEWNAKILAASMSSGFDGPIAHHNPDGLSCIDFLEEVDGEYYRITSDIRSIYDALGDDGLAWVALQKHSQARVGRGGEGTTEKARLYLTMDILLHRPHCTISAVKIIKAKDYPEGSNPNGKEIHVEIRNGYEMRPVSEWMYCNEKQKEQYIHRYEHMIDSGKELPVAGEMRVIARFYLDDGSHGNLRARDFERWKESFTNLDLESEVLGLARWTKSKPLKKSGWFHQLAGILNKKNEKLQYQDAPF